MKNSSQFEQLRIDGWFNKPKALIIRGKSPSVQATPNIFFKLDDRKELTKQKGGHNVPTVISLISSKLFRY